MFVRSNSFAHGVVYFALNHAENGGKVILQSYLSMPHVFVVFDKHPSTQACYREMAQFVMEVTSGHTIETKMQVVNGKGEISEMHMNLREPVFSKSEVSFLPFVG
jgi:hypothetical protein